MVVSLGFRDLGLCGFEGLGFRVLLCKPCVNPPVMGTTTDHCSYIQALLAPHSGAITIGGSDE